MRQQALPSYVPPSESMCLLRPSSECIEGPNESKYDVRSIFQSFAEIVTIGQYPRPTPGHRTIYRYVQLEKFAE